jgi:hypothetical protein
LIKGYVIAPDSRPREAGHDELDQHVDEPHDDEDPGDVHPQARLDHLRNREQGGAEDGDGSGTAGRPRHSKVLLQWIADSHGTLISR